MPRSARHWIFIFTLSYSLTVRRQVCCHMSSTAWVRIPAKEKAHTQGMHHTMVRGRAHREEREMVHRWERGMAHRGERGMAHRLVKVWVHSMG